MPYANIRSMGLFGSIIGATVLDVTQHDEDEFKEDGTCYFCLHFDNGVTVKVDIGEDGGFSILNVPSEGDGTIRIQKPNDEP